MSEQIIPVSTDLWLVIEQAAFASDELFRLCSSSSGDEILIDKEEVSALIGALHKVLDEHGTKEQGNGK